MYAVPDELVISFDVVYAVVAAPSEAELVYRAKLNVFPEDAVKLAIHIQKSKPFDEDKLIKIAIDHAKEMAEKKVKKLVEDALEKESEDELLN